MEARSLAYLDAMGIDVWQPRRAAPDDESGPCEPQILIGAGDGDILCIVESESETKLKLASDIGAAMRSAPVWSWPSHDPGLAADTMTIANAVSEKMLTRILIFGENLASVIFSSEVPAVVSAARVHVVPGLNDLAQDSGAKRILWALMNENGIAASRSGER